MARRTSGGRASKTPRSEQTRIERIKATWAKKRRAARRALKKETILDNQLVTPKKPRGVKRFKAIGTVTGRTISDRPSHTERERLTQLGNKVFAASDPALAVIETVPAPTRDFDGVGWVRFICSEFTSLCPVTGQPDFATFVIDYVVHKRLIESKSLKLFLGSFRSHAGFAEAVTAMIADRLYNAARPDCLIVEGYWAARGGIPIHVHEKRGVAPFGNRRPQVPVIR